MPTGSWCKHQAKSKHTALARSGPAAKVPNAMVAWPAHHDTTRPVCQSHARDMLCAQQAKTHIESTCQHATHTTMVHRTQTALSNHRCHERQAQHGRQPTRVLLLLHTAGNQQPRQGAAPRWLASNQPGRHPNQPPTNPPSGHSGQAHRTCRRSIQNYVILLHSRHTMLPGNSTACRHQHNR